jgi:hypothetical protein
MIVPFLLILLLVCEHSSTSSVVAVDMVLVPNLAGRNCERQSIDSIIVSGQIQNLVTRHSSLVTRHSSLGTPLEAIPSFKRFLNSSL